MRLQPQVNGFHIRPESLWLVGEARNVPPQQDGGAYVRPIGKPVVVAASKNSKPHATSTSFGTRALGESLQPNTVPYDACAASFVRADAPNGSAEEFSWRKEFRNVANEPRP